MKSCLVYFYPHSYLRDRQLDTIRRWSEGQVINPELAQVSSGAQVSRTKALRQVTPVTWKNLLPLANVKRRPRGLAASTPVYVWGAVMVSGPFILDLDNPYALVGYNIRAMPLWRPILRRVLQSRRCLEIRCMSAACREGLIALFGDNVGHKARVVYPYVSPPATVLDCDEEAGPRFLFIGTQFEIKGGAALLKAFAKVRKELPTESLHIVTHLPREYQPLTILDGLTVHAAQFTREEIWRKFMARADILVHPTYVESFGMVVLEALAHGLAVIATDVYALKEMVHDGINGRLLAPPISFWNGVRPAHLYYKWRQAAQEVRKIDSHPFAQELADAMIALGGDHDRLVAARRASRRLFEEVFLASALRTG